MFKPKFKRSLILLPPIYLYDSTTQYLRAINLELVCLMTLYLAQYQSKCEQDMTPPFVSPTYSALTIEQH